MVAKIGLLCWHAAQLLLMNTSKVNGDEPYRCPGTSMLVPAG